MAVFVHDNYQVVLQLENNKPTHQYLWGTNQDELLCDNNNWTLGDHLNSVRDIVSATGSVEHFEYDAFGKLLSDNSADVTFAYTGKMRDNVSDLQWNINRWYDANVGRWCSEDPIGFVGGDRNTTRYVVNNPLNRVDYYGLKWTNAQFVFHYYFGGGTEVSLGAAGLLDDFRLAAPVKKITEAYMKTAIDKLYALADNCMGGEEELKEDSKWINVTTHPNLFVYGDTKVIQTGKVFVSCEWISPCSCTCNLYIMVNIHVDDTFKDPLDIGIEPGGKPYKLTGFWSDERGSRVKVDLSTKQRTVLKN